MITFECKSCGAPISADEKQTTVVCRHCNLLQTFNLNQKLNGKLMAHADRLRRAMEYDRAISMYEQILKDDPENPEVHWGRMLCRFGVAYVADANTGKRIPTCNRMSETSVFLDPDYQECIENASMEAQMIYEDGAREIEKIRNIYYQIAQKEEPYDVFISYKDSENDMRTRDSSMAEEVYTFLTDAGYRVFYSRITLANILGEDYEPYIYAALQSARVMLVLGTKPEYINAEWVKNEWSRYLKLVLAEPEKRALIPLLREMKASELPEELAGFEGYDMANWRFRNSLLEQVQSICDKKTELLKEKAEDMQEANYRVHMISAENLLVRAKLELEEGTLERADMFVERALDLNPQSSEGYWLKLKIYTNNFRDLKDDDTRAVQLYERAMRTGSEQKKREYEIQWNKALAEIHWNKFEQRRNDEIQSKEQGDIILSLAEEAFALNPSKSEYKDGAEQYRRHMDASLLKISIQNTYGPGKNQYTEKVEAMEQNIANLCRGGKKESNYISCFPYFLPAFVICIELVYLTINAEGLYTDFVAKVLNVTILVTLVMAGSFCTTSKMRNLFIGIGVLAGVWNLFRGGTIAHLVIVFGVLFVNLILITLGQLLEIPGKESREYVLKRQQNKLKNILKKWKEDYAKAVKEAKKKYPEMDYECDPGSCRSTYAEDIFGDLKKSEGRFVGNIVGTLMRCVGMAVVLLGMYFASAYLSGVILKNPEVRLDNISAYVTEIPVEDVLNNWAEQVKQGVAK